MAIHEGKIPRPDMFGYSRLARQLHKVETAIVRLHRGMAHNNAIPLPLEPETAYERWERKREDDEFDRLFSDIAQANPSVFNNNSN